MNLLLGDDIDNVCGIYFNDNGTMLSDKQFNIDKDDSIIIDNVRYIGTPRLYELIFKRFPNEAVFTEDNK